MRDVSCIVCRMDAKQIYAEFIAPHLVPGAGGCLLWLGETYQGYGVVYAGGRNRRVHRVALESRLGSPLGKFMACHSCDVPNCANPEHLFPGTAKSNWQDAVKKGRNIFGLKSVQPWAVGEGHHKARLSNSDVLAIRAAIKSGAQTYKQLHVTYNVTTKHLQQIVARKRWAHLP